MSERERLALYQSPTCPYCRRVRSYLASIGEEVETRDITLDSGHIEDLARATDSQTVPCLRIEPANGDERWLHESGDIIEYLEDYFAKG
ncbi:MAG: glutaredoxin [bacterium]|nr:glutaredoxin [bacterium]